MNSTRKAWLVMLAVYLAGVTVALNQSKVPPAMQVLLTSFHMDTTTGGWLMSAFAIAGMILGLPAALILDRLGPKQSGLIALGCTMLGSVLGALANEPVLLLTGRVIEGTGLGLIAVVAPAVISVWFPPDRRGMPMGVWASWVPIGGFIMYNLAGPLLGAFGWQGIWWFGAAFALVAFVIYAATVSAPPQARALDGMPHAAYLPLGQLLINPSGWVLALVFACFNFAFMAYSTWNPTYLHASLGLGPDTANFDASLTSLAVIPSTLLAGWLLDRVKQRPLVLAVALLAVSVLLFWCFQLGSASLVAPYVLVLGLVGGVIPTAIFTLAPETMPHPRFAGVALGLISIGQNLGLFFGPPIVGAIIGNGNWAGGVIPIVSAAAISLVAAVLFYFLSIEKHSPLAEQVQD